VIAALREMVRMLTADLVELQQQVLVRDGGFPSLGKYPVLQAWP
jgi:hypothetical protein